MIKEKINGILNKIKNNKKKVIGVTIVVFAVFIFTFTVYNLNNPTKFNRLFANVLNNGKPVNDAFEDNTFYSCVVDAYNSANGTSKAYTDNLTDEELASITNLTCQGWNYSNDDKITSAKGVENLTGLTTLDLSSNQLASIDLSQNTNLTELNLPNNQLTSIDVSKNTSLTTLDLRSNQLASIDVSNNTSLTDLDLSYNQLTSIDVSKNTALTTLNLDSNQLASIDVSNNTSLEFLYLSNNQLTNIDLSNNTSLINLNLSSNQLASIDLSQNTNLTKLDLQYNLLTNINLGNNTSLTTLDLRSNQLASIDLGRNTALISLYIDDTPLCEDILMQVGETYQIEEKIVPPEGQNITYSIADTSVATIEGNTITAKSEGSTKLTTTLGNISFDKILMVGKPKLSALEGIIIDDNHEVIIVTNKDAWKNIDGYVHTNIGNLIIDGDTLKVLYNGEEQLSYKLLYVGEINDNKYYVNFSNVNNVDEFNIETINCTAELSNNKDALSIKYNNQKIYEMNIKIINVYLPDGFEYKNNEGELLDGGTILLYKNNSFGETLINNITDINNIDKNKINIINGKMKYELGECNDDGTHCYYELSIYSLEDEEDSVDVYDLINIYSKNYDLTKDYIYLGIDEFKNSINIMAYGQEASFEELEEMNFFKMTDQTFELWDVDSVCDKYKYECINVPYEKIKAWNLIKVTSDKYDMSSDTINLGNEDIDLTQINVTNATLKKEDNKLLIMYGDEVVKEFKLEGGKKTTTTTKKDDEKTTATKDKTTTKKEVKTTTTKKKVSIIDKIFGNKETTTAKKEETTTKKNIFRKSTTTKVENSSGNVTSNNKNSFKKLVTGSNLLILLLSITDIALIIYIIIDKKKNEEA